MPQSTYNFVAHDPSSLVTDGQDGVASAKVVVTVTAPQGDSASSATSEGSSSASHSCTTNMNAAVIYVISTDAASFTVSDGAHGTCSVTAESTIMYEPTEGFAGLDTCEYESCDAESSCATGILTITILPVATPLKYETTADVAVEIEVDSIFKVAVASSPANGYASALEPNLLTYISKTGFEGSDLFQYEICLVEDESLCDTSTVSITVLSSTLVEASMEDIAEDVAPIQISENGSNDIPGFAFFDDDTIFDVEIVDSDPLTSFMCDDVDPSFVNMARVLYKYPIVLDAEEYLYAVVENIEKALNERFVDEITCGSSTMVGANSNPADFPSEQSCTSDKGPCFIINGGMTVFGDVDIQEVKDLIVATLPDIVSVSGANIVSATKAAQLDSKDSSGDSTGNLKYVAMAGAAVAALLGASLFIRKRRHSMDEDSTDETERVLMNEFSDSILPSREIPLASSNSTASFLPGESRGPISPAFSIGSKKRDYDVEDTVDL